MNYRSLLLGLTGAAMTATTLLAELPGGADAPDFEATDSNGHVQKLSDYKGKYVVLEWLNPDCPFIRKHYKTGNMQGLQKEFTGKGVVWLSICSSAPGKQGDYSAEDWNKMTAEKGAAPTAVLLDRDGKIGHLYGAKTTPHMFVINPDGKLIYQGALDDQPNTDPASVKRAHNYVRAALEESMAGKPVSVEAEPSYGCSVKYE